jgi:hypothetical protein
MLSILLYVFLERQVQVSSLVQRVKLSWVLYRVNRISRNRVWAVLTQYRFHLSSARQRFVGIGQHWRVLVDRTDQSVPGSSPKIGRP